MQTMRRYYSNTLSDSEKQNTMNIFLGIFVPEPGKPPIWEKDYNFDYYIHHQKPARECKPLTQWWNPELLEFLPFSLDIGRKTCTELTRTQNMNDIIDDFYHPFELTVLQDLFAFAEINHSVRDYMPNCTTDFSPFSVRVRLGKKREEMSSAKANLTLKNPNLAGKSTSSNTSTDDESDQSGSDSSDSESESEQDSLEGDNTAGYISFESVFPSFESVYGKELVAPNKEDMQLYRRSAALSRDSGPLPGHRKASATSVPHPLARPILRPRACPIPVHDYSQCLLPPIPEASRKIYENYIKVGQQGPNNPSEKTLEIYRNYVNMYKNTS
jgi:hypothetical protein